VTYTITFIPAGEDAITVQVDSAQFPFQEDGLPGSLLDIALGHNIDLQHNCGGKCACTTCHVIVNHGMENLSKVDEDEEDRLDTAEGLTLNSRLGCQAVVYGDVVVEIPLSGRGGYKPPQH